MNDRFLAYLKREHDRLQMVIEEEMAKHRSDSTAIARLKKQRQVVEDQIFQWQQDCSVAA